ncbi:MAG: geranylgeranylglycerol-phosphate geranylgeranyltransferase [Candidatus Bathyarchaeota archaeon]|nr:geranylgeranylglycerol-phosphate geranylgeranyltransferase [Candidatus Bathyarchaeota archaeon]
MHKAGEFLKLIRPANCILMGFAVIVGVALANEAVLFNASQQVLLGFITAFTLTAASMVINDYYDREIDAINEPQRPIPKGTVKPREALFFAFILTAIGFLAALFTNLQCFLLSIVAWNIFVTYTTKGKATGLLGNILVSICIVIPFLYGNLLAAQQIQPAIIIFVVMAFLSNTGREINKGIVDLEGDRKNNIKTIAVKYGEKSAAIMASIFYVAAVLLTPLPLLRNLVSIWFVPFVVITNLGLIMCSASLLYDYSRDNARKIKNYVLIWFLFGLLAFIFGTVIT